MLCWKDHTLSTHHSISAPNLNFLTMPSTVPWSMAASRASVGFSFNPKQNPCNKMRKPVAIQAEFGLGRRKATEIIVSGPGLVDG